MGETATGFEYIMHTSKHFRGQCKHVFFIFRGVADKPTYPPVGGNVNLHNILYINILNLVGFIVLMSR